MLYRFRYGVFVVLAAVTGLTGYRIYNYFFDTTIPLVTMSGIDDSGFYAGDISCKVASNKKGNLSVLLDGQPLISNYRLSLKEHEHPFIIPSKTINNGKHALKIELIDSSFAKNKGNDGLT